MSDDQKKDVPLKPERPPEYDFPNLEASLESDQRTGALFDSLDICDSQQILTENKDKK